MQILAAGMPPSGGRQPHREIAEKTESRYMAADVFRTVAQTGSGYYEEKKSRFLAEIRRVDTEGEMQAFLEEIRKKHYDARHHCFAYVIGEKDELTRASDAGEPSGTAGRPILDVLTGAGLHNAGIVVTRYFGGTLLGTGGLSRAYGAAAKDAVEHCQIQENVPCMFWDIQMDYTLLGKVQYFLAQKEIPALDTQYTDRVCMRIALPLQSEKRLRQEMTELTGGQITFAGGTQGMHVF